MALVQEEARFARGGVAIQLLKFIDLFRARPRVQRKVLKRNLRT